MRNVSCLAFGGGKAINKLSAECTSGMQQHPLRKSKGRRSMTNLLQKAGAGVAGSGSHRTVDTETTEVVENYDDSATNAATPPSHKRKSLIKSLHRAVVSFWNFQDIVGHGHQESGAGQSGAAKKNKIQSYISNQKWSKLRKYLDTEEGQLSPSKREADQDQDTLLHLACQEHPPLDIIQRLQEANPSWISAKDKDQRLPLHVAAAKGAHPVVVQYLLELSPQDAFSMKDISGRTPLQLHQDLCCDDQTRDPSCSCQEEHDQNHESALDNMIDADLDMFNDFVTVNAYRTYGPIEEVVTMLQQAQRGGSLQASSREEQCGDESTYIGDGSRACSNVQEQVQGISVTPCNAFLSFLNPSDMGSLCEPVVPIAATDYWRVDHELDFWVDAHTTPAALLHDFDTHTPLDHHRVRFQYIAEWAKLDCSIYDL
jgi:hypothetical protein